MEQAASELEQLVPTDELIGMKRPGVPTSLFVPLVVTSNPVIDIDILHAVAHESAPSMR